MATLTRADMISKVMQRLAVLGAGESEDPNDTTLVGRILDSAHDRYRKRGMAPFATSAFPMWAQEPFAMIIAAEAGPYFGVRVPQDKVEGEEELVKQMHEQISHTPTKFKAY